MCLTMPRSRWPRMLFVRALGVLVHAAQCGDGAESRPVMERSFTGGSLGGIGADEPQPDNILHVFLAHRSDVDAPASRPPRGGVRPAKALASLPSTRSGPAGAGAGKSPRSSKPRKPRKTVPTHKIMDGPRVVRWCEECAKTVNYKNYSKHVRGVHKYEEEEESS